MDIINRIWMPEGHKRMRRDEGGWVDRGLPGATRAPAWETDRKLRLILGQKPLFTCHGINKEKRSYFFRNRSIVLQRAVAAGCTFHNREPKSPEFYVDEIVTRRTAEPASLVEIHK